MDPEQLSGDDLRGLFAELDDELRELGGSISLLVCGGAAIVLRSWGVERRTNDVDVVSEGMTPELRAAAERVARQRGSGSATNPNEVASTSAYSRPSVGRWPC